MDTRSKIISMLGRLVQADIPTDSLCYLVDDAEWNELQSDADAMKLHPNGGFAGDEVTVGGMWVRRRRQLKAVK